MHPARPKADTVEEYIALFPKETQTKLERIRNRIQTIAPQATESISYAIPTYKVGKAVLIYFAGYEKHISLYPLPKHPSSALAKAIEPYVAGKGTLRFSLDAPLPLELIDDVIAQRLADIS